MCEIAVVDPDQFSIQNIQQLAGNFHEEQGDGIGVFMVIPDGDTFTYESYKSADPHWQTLWSFTRRHIDDAWRVVIHGRAGTSGGVSREAAHPIHVDCDDCSVEHIIHNGSVRNRKQKMKQLKRNGHDFTTGVDTEIIAHKVGDLPASVEEHTSATYKMYGNLNYLVFAEDGFLIHTEKKYHLSEDVTMTCRYRDFEDPEELGFEKGTDTEWMLVTPSEEDNKVATVEMKERSSSSYRGSSTSTRSSGANWRGGQTGSSTTAHPQASPNENDAGLYEEQFVDHYPESDDITAIKVAPGVMKIIDTENDVHDFIFRRDTPRMYFWYAPEDSPVDQDVLNEYRQTSIGDWADDVPEGDHDWVEAYGALIEEEEGIPLEQAEQMAVDVYHRANIGERDNAAVGTTGD
jgi:predicted glutamine amidotransferase